MIFQVQVTRRNGPPLTPETSAAEMIPAGYNAKIIEAPQEWLGNPQVTEILSVSECISESPIDHTSHWLCNQWLLYDSEDALAKAVAKTEVKASLLRWFFYEVHGEELEEGSWRPIEDCPKGITRPQAGYSFRGFDIVSVSCGAGPECSPLSCNSGAQHFPVNTFCLLDSLEQAIQVATRIDEDGGYEPGPYRIMAVSERDSQPSDGSGCADAE